MKSARWLVPGLVLVASCSRPPHADSAAPALPVALPLAQPVPVAVPQPSTPAAQAAPATPQPAAEPSVPAATPPTAATGDVFERAIPPWDAATTQHVRQLFQAGGAAGNQADVFAKVGDSITESGSFLGDLGHGWYDLGRYTRLEPVVRLFSRHAFSADREDNPFTRGSQSATAGWTTEDLLDGGDQCPLEQELNSLHPAFAFVMIGTNDAARGGLPRYEHNLGTILDRIEAHHTVAMVSTIPDETTEPQTTQAVVTINGIIRRVAAARHLPLIDYSLALSTLPAHGLSDDHIHPSVYVQGHDTKAGVFTPAGLAFGYNVRNLTAVLMLERVVQTLSLH